MKASRINTVINCLLISAIFLSSCKSPSALTEEDKQYIRDLTTRVEDAWNRGERETYVNRFAADAIYMAPNMEAIVGKDAIRTFANSFPDVKIHFNLIEIMGSSSYAYVRGAFTVTNSADTLMDKGKFLSVWQKSHDNKWLLTHDIFSSDLPIPMAKEAADKEN